MKKVCSFFTPKTGSKFAVKYKRLPLAVYSKLTVIIHSFLQFNNELLLFKSGGPVTKWLQASF